MSLLFEIKAFLKKILYVTVPCGCKLMQSTEVEWDISGPFFMIILLGMLMTLTKSESENYFVTVFVILIAGAMVVSVNCQILKSECSFYEILNIFCFCIFPLFLQELLISLFYLSQRKTIARLVVIGTLIWSIYAISNFLWNIAPKRRKFSVILPASIMYGFICYLNTWNLF